MLTAILATQLAPARGAETPLPPSPTKWVTDNASVLSPATRDTLEKRLAAYSRATGHQVIVWIGTTTGDAPLEDWTIRAFTAWKVGRKGLNDGVALFIFMQDRKVRIEVGYGLEPVLTDAISSRIVRNEISARMKTGMVDEAVSAGVSAILATIGGEQGATANQGTRYASSDNTAAGLFALAFFVVTILLVFGIIIYRTIHSLYPIGSSGRTHPAFFGPIFGGWSSGIFSGGFSGGGGSFGGFSGGGGMGGGGGASGGW